MNWKNILERVAWTFVESFTGTVLAVELVLDPNELKTVALAGLVAGISSVVAFIKTLAKDRLDALRSSKE